MRSIDTGSLDPLGEHGFGPWRLGGDRVLKASAHGEPLRTEADAQRVLDAYRAAYDTGALTPRPYEVVRVGDAFGVVVGYVPGMGMIPHIIFGSYTPQEAGEAMGGLMRRLHGARATGGRDINAAFRGYACVLAPMLPRDVGERLVPLVDAIPQPRALLHGDLHLGNVVVAGGEPALIDMELAGFGHPICDLAITRTRLLLNSVAPVARGRRDLVREAKRAVWESLLPAYLGDEDPAGLRALDRATSVLAELEHCCFKYEVGRTGAAPDARQRRRVDLCAERLRSVLPQVDRLYF